MLQSSVLCMASWCCLLACVSFRTLCNVLLNAAGTFFLFFSTLSLFSLPKLYMCGKRYFFSSCVAYGEQCISCLFDTVMSWAVTLYCHVPYTYFVFNSSSSSSSSSRAALYRSYIENIIQRRTLGLPFWLSEGNKHLCKIVIFWYIFDLILNFYCVF